MRRPVDLTVAAALMLLIAVGIILFWIVFFADLDAQRESTFASRSEAWFAWELSFPLADAWVARTATLGAIGCGAGGRPGCNLDWPAEARWSSWG